MENTLKNTPTKKASHSVEDRLVSSEEEFLAEIFNCKSSSPKKPSLKRHFLEGMFQDSQIKLAYDKEQNIIDMPDDIVLESYILESTV